MRVVDSIVDAWTARCWSPPTPAAAPRPTTLDDAEGSSCSATPAASTQAARSRRPREREPGVAHPACARSTTTRSTASAPSASAPCSRHLPRSPPSWPRPRHARHLTSSTDQDRGQRQQVHVREEIHRQVPRRAAPQGARPPRHRRDERRRGGARPPGTPPRSTPTPSAIPQAGSTRGSRPGARPAGKDREAKELRKPPAPSGATIFPGWSTGGQQAVFAGRKELLQDRRGRHIHADERRRHGETASSRAACNVQAGTENQFIVGTTVHQRPQGHSLRHPAIASICQGKNRAPARKLRG